MFRFNTEILDFNISTDRLAVAPITLIRLAITIAFFVLIFIIVRISFKKLLQKNNQVHTRFFKSIVEVAILTVGLYFCLAEIDVIKNLGTTLLQSSALILAIATFAAQKVLANLISGISLSVIRPFNIGDKIIVSSGGSILSEGIVTDINIRHTIIQKFDGRCDIIPNGVIDECVITNSDTLENIGSFLEVEISYESDADKACEILERIVYENPLTLNTPESTHVLVRGFETNGVALKVLVTTANLNDSFTGCSNIRKEILKQFRENNIVIPYTTITIDSIPYRENDETK